MLLLICCSSLGDRDRLVLKVSHNGGADHAFQDAYEYMGDYLQDSIAPDLDFQIFPASQIAGEKEAIEMLKLGVIASTPASAGALGSFVPEADLFNFPFLFKDLDHFYRVMDGPVGTYVAEKIEKKLDCLVLGWWFAGVRNVWNSERPITKPEDLKGLKIRVIGSAIVLDAFNAFGAQATNMSFGELYSAIQQGVLDGAECDNTDLYVEKFYEITKYVSQTEHLFLSVALLYSKKQFEKLDQDAQKHLLEAGKRSVQVQRKAMEIKTDEALTALREEGLVFNELDKGKFQTIATDVYADHLERIGGADLLNEIQRLQ